MPRERTFATAFVLAFAVSLVLGGAAHAQEPAYLSPSNVLRFADFLFEDGDHRRAAVEYERYLALASLTDAEAAAIQLKIGLSLQKAGDLARASVAYRRVVEKYPDTSEALDARVHLARALLMAGEYEAVRTLVAGSSSVVQSRERDSSLAGMYGGSLLFEKRWAEAAKYLRAVPDDGARDSSLANLRQVASDGLALPRKSPMLAGFLSAVVPGTGRIYAGRKGDGLMSLVSIATTGWLARSGFRRSGSSSVKGWIYGSMAAFLYVGNVYGSAVAVQIRNEQAEAGLLKRTALTINVDLK